MLVLPEEKCEDQKHFNEGLCVPCPTGSVYNKHIDECEWCKVDEYYNENLSNFFESECDLCPSGTVGGYEMECLPCDAGFIFDPAAQFQSCKPCSSQSICPVGTKYEFPKTRYLEELDEVIVRNVPETYKPLGEKVDNTATLVFCFWILCGVGIFVFIASMN